MPENDTVTLPSFNGSVTLSRDHDMTHLRAWLIENATIALADGHEQVSILPHLRQPLITVAIPSQNIVFTIEQIETMASAVIEGRIIERESDVPDNYPGQPLVAVTNIGGVDYAQGEAEPTPAFEGRVINDLMLRRGRELMRDHGIDATTAAAAVRAMVDRAGASGLGSPATRALAPAAATLEGVRRLTREDEATLVVGITTWGDNVPLRADVANVMQRAGLTSANMTWLREQTDILPASIPASVFEPTALEAWRD